jgi:hypothetical protein
MNKIFCRFRFLEINYGPHLMTYFEFSAKKFDPPSLEGKDVIAHKSSEYRRNMTTFRVHMDIFSFDSLRTILYTASWILKFVAYKVLSSSWISG